jgi:DNA polymerase-3 subunit gamma/tau
VLAAENVPADAASVALVARAAEGSLRDALSLLDQAIAHGGGKLEEASTRAMLGAVDQTYLYAILRALAARDGAELVAGAGRMAERSLSFEAALQDLASLLHRVALAQVVPQSIADDDPDAAAIRELVQAFAAEDLQLHYQIAVQGRAEIGLAPDEHAGFMMTLLRMLAFAPAAGMPAAAATAVPRARGAEGQSASAPVVTTAASVKTNPASWAELVGQLGLNAMAHQLALRCEMTARTADLIELRISPVDERMFDKPYRDKLTAALRQRLGAQLKVAFIAGEVAGLSPKAITDRKTGQRQAAAVAEIREDPFVRELIEDFDGSVEDASIKPK